jgi:hypothetical protein
MMEEADIYNKGGHNQFSQLARKMREMNMMSWKPFKIGL